MLVISINVPAGEITNNVMYETKENIIVLKDIKFVWRYNYLHQIQTIQKEVTIHEYAQTLVIGISSSENLEMRGVSYVHNPN